jgi:hypothetical protein
VRSRGVAGQAERPVSDQKRFFETSDGWYGRVNHLFEGLSESRGRCPAWAPVLAMIHYTARKSRSTGGYVLRLEFFQTGATRAW